MSYCLGSRGALRLTALVAAFGLSNLGCEDESPAVSADGSGGSAGADAGSLEASSTGGTAGTGGGALGVGGVGVGSAGSASDGGSRATSESAGVGGAGGTEAATGGSAGGAGAPTWVDACWDDPRCGSLAAGSVCRGPFKTTCADTNADGCLEFTQTNCAPGACDDGECVAPGEDAGDACGDAVSVLGSGFFLSGADFGADFASDLEVSHSTCQLLEEGAPDAVFEVALEAGETLSVVERGDLDAVVQVQAVCGASERCLAASDDVEDEPLEYTATEAETVSVVVEAWDPVPNPAWYRLHIDIDAACGNGLLEGTEDCDVGEPAVTPGCSEDCLVEFGYTCEATSPSACRPLPSLGEFDITGDIAPIMVEDKFEVWDEHRYLVTFTEAVVLEFEARTATPGTGDVNIEILNEAGRVEAYRVTGDELVTGEPGEHEPLGLVAGTYLIRVYAETPLPEGYEMEFWLRDPGECGDGVVEPALEACDTGGEPGCSEACAVEFDYLCDGLEPTVCQPIESLGSFGAAATPDPTEVAAAVPVGESSYWIFSLTEDVVLSGSVAAIDGAGDPEVFIYAASGGYYPYVWENIGDESFALFLPAGDYKIEVYAHDALDSGYTLTLATAAP